MRQLALCLASICVFTVTAAEKDPAMTQDGLHGVIKAYASDVRVTGSMAEFVYEEVQLLCISDPRHDRIRIMAPIVRVAEVEPKLLHVLLAANFHTALDARYALSDGVVYAVYLHPLGSLQEAQVQSAIRQVASLYNTFGSTFSSGELVFPGGDEAEDGDTNAEDGTAI